MVYARRMPGEGPVLKLVVDALWEAAGAEAEAAAFTSSGIAARMPGGAGAMVVVMIHEEARPLDVERCAAVTI